MALFRAKGDKSRIEERPQMSYGHSNSLGLGPEIQVLIPILEGLR